VLEAEDALSAHGPHEPDADYSYRGRLISYCKLCSDVAAAAPITDHNDKAYCCVAERVRAARYRRSIRGRGRAADGIAARPPDAASPASSKLLHLQE